MQRTILIVLTTAVIAAGIATGATILLSDNDEIAVATAAPTVPPAEPAATTAVSTASPTVGSPVASPAATSGTAASPAASPSATATDAPVRSGSSIDCSREPNYCSDTTGRMEVADDRLRSVTTTRDDDVDHSGLPTVKMTSKVLRPNDTEAETGDDVKSLHVAVVVRNDTDKTFVFPKREIVLDIYRNGRLYERLPTKGDGFEMTPGGEMRGKFDQPILRDGTYTWQAKTWYRPK